MSKKIDGLKTQCLMGCGMEAAARSVAAAKRGLQRTARTKAGQGFAADSPKKTFVFKLLDSDEKNCAKYLL